MNKTPAGEKKTEIESKQFRKTTQLNSWQEKNHELQNRRTEGKIPQ